MPGFASATVQTLAAARAGLLRLGRMANRQGQDLGWPSVVGEERL